MAVVEQFKPGKLGHEFTGSRAASPRSRGETNQILDVADKNVVQANGSLAEGLLLSEAERVDKGRFAALEGRNTVYMYLIETSQFSLLTATEEVGLAKRIEMGMSALHELSRDGFNPKKRSDLEAAIADGRAACSHFIAANTRLVVSIAKKYIGRGVPFLDLIQEGNIGLIRAVHKFDYRRGTKFSYYATNWIRLAVSRAIKDQSRTIRVPVYTRDLISKLIRVSDHLTQELGRDPTPQELADAMHTPVKKAEKLIQVARRILSLEASSDGDVGPVLIDSIEDDQAVSPERAAMDNLLKQHIQAMLATLPSQEATVLRLRFGLHDGNSYSWAEIGIKLGLTWNRVRVIEAKALTQLRQGIHALQLHDYIR